ncbi:TetR/AcrR family transcriptional regulator [Corynebacterium sp. TAE3-ERU12]|uniref:TetR/AcrR family transcriptional regulator n=1 Tax=Corynebacterium sp. TAE3-ERU12 TaxID=2849491 RepID=UPI001C490C0D|nr:TetR/AcrR family transcriptional regulator [Corynebacterium sp. TAE3-ERU12]MBV7296142.1 TetR/AcrR family transcriptional regulator [Corynebacterium sp. TAE3-ERU12]
MSTHGQRRPSSAETRARIVEVATEYFTRKPFSTISLKEIAEEAGVSAPLIIKYFRTKEGLLESLIDFEPLRTIVCDVPFDSLGESLADNAINGDRTGPSSLIALLMATAGSQSAVRTVTDKFQDTIGGALFERIRDEAPGVACDDDAEQRCQYALAMYTGLATVMINYTRGIPIEGNKAVQSYGSHIQCVLDSPIGDISD